MDDPFDIFENFFGGKRKKLTKRTLAIIAKAQEIIAQYDVPLTVRQIYYRFVSEQIIPNNQREYKKLAKKLADARELGYIPYNAIVDRTRSVYSVDTWSNPKDFFDTVKDSYKKDLLCDQENYVEVWVEKDALAGLFEPITNKYQVPLLVGRGYPSHSALYESSLRQRKQRKAGKTPVILYFGDLDPSGEDIYRDVSDRMTKLFYSPAKFYKIALNPDDVTKYNLPQDPAKKSDSRHREFVERFGDISVELDALPPDVLTKRIEESIVNQLNMDLFEKNIKLQERDLSDIRGVVSKLSA